MEHFPINFLTMNNKIFRNSQIYLDKMLKKYDLSSGSFRYLFIIEQEEGLSQNEISQKIGNDKAMSARIISKLVKSEYVERIQDSFDNRAYQLFLTEKAHKMLPELKNELLILSEHLTDNLTIEEKKILINLLFKVYTNTKKIK